ncbi:MAG: hypothetical protein KBF21_05285 [Thermoanaerobaculia bacterium]|nr:hypothetical protein [Thermoanaerobaculia bacterium]MBP9823618.1 hypothetical protein [Thermoanaerobaculia bacterium]
MDAITLRKLPPHVAEAVRKRAAEQKTSLNRAVIGLLEESTSIAAGATKEERHELDALCGAWSPSEARNFDRALADLRRLDPDLWE